MTRVESDDRAARSRGLNPSTAQASVEPAADARRDAPAPAADAISEIIEQFFRFRPDRFFRTCHTLFLQKRSFRTGLPGTMRGDSQDALLSPMKFLVSSFAVFSLTRWVLVGAILARWDALSSAQGLAQTRTAIVIVWALLAAALGSVVITIEDENGERLSRSTVFVVLSRTLMFLVGGFYLCLILSEPVAYDDLDHLRQAHGLLTTFANGLWCAAITWLFLHIFPSTVRRLSSSRPWVVFLYAAAVIGSGTVLILPLFGHRLPFLPLLI